MLTIVQAHMEQDAGSIRELFGEYLEWLNGMLTREFEVSLDVGSMLEADLADLIKFAPPSGRLLLAQYEGQFAGSVCLRRLSNEVGEVKRVYVRPAFRGQGIGQVLLAKLLDEARLIGYARIRLDSGPFMTAAHALYRSAGFHEIEGYPESEAPSSFHPRWVFMERSLE